MITGFQFTLPHGERQDIRRTTISSFTRFNSRSRMGSDERHRRIHAEHATSPLPRPPWAPPCGARSPPGAFSVSIHAPAWGATIDDLKAEVERWVSIHAPAWGATRLRGTPCVLAGFQFTLPHGERLDDTFALFLSDVFQFTLPHGERPARQAATAAGNARFNSRSRMGSDPRARGRARGAGVSIHAPAWGATGRGGRGRDGREVSIHAPAWGATGWQRRACRRTCVSIHAPAWGATSSSTASASPAAVSIHAVSIHAPAWGATVAWPRAKERQHVSIHAPAWGATPRWARTGQ